VKRKNDGLVNPGRYYTEVGGRLDETPAGPPDVVVCRRLADFPRQQLPNGGRVGACRRCLAPIVFNWEGPHQNRPRICMQCAGIQPLPIEES